MRWGMIGAAAACLGVALGAFGAHGLKSRLSPDLLAIFETGVRYQIYHAFALLATAWAAQVGDPGPARWAGWCFLLGTVLFSGSLYTLALTGIRRFGAVTPLGGVLFLAGWIFLGIGLARRGV